MRQSLVFTPLESPFVSEEKRAEFDLFWKESLLEGIWQHPTKGFKLEVTKKYLDSLAANFKKQKEREIDVPIPVNHSYSEDANRGHVEEVEVRQREDGTHSLWTLLGVTEPEACDRIKNKTTRGVSVALKEDAKHSTPDGKVEDLGNCLEHVALTSYPVITGMGDFIAVGFSGEPISVAHLSLVDESDRTSEEEEVAVLDPESLRDLVADEVQKGIGALNLTREPTGGMNMSAITAEQLRTMEQKFGIKQDSLTEENLFETLNGFQLGTEGEEGEENEEETPEFDITKDPAFAVLQQQNAMLIQDRNQQRLASIKDRLKGLVGSGRINKAVYDQIVTDEKQLQFSQECVGDNWDQWAMTVEGKINAFEQLPEKSTVDAGQHLGRHTTNFLDQEQETEEEDLNKITDEAIMAVTPQFHKANVKIGPNGLFMATASK